MIRRSYVFLAALYWGTCSQVDTGTGHLKLHCGLHSCSVEGLSLNSLDCMICAEARALWRLVMCQKIQKQLLKILCLLRWTPALLWDASHQKIYNCELSTGMVPWALAMISSGIIPQPVELLGLDENYKREFHVERWAYSLMKHWVIWVWLEGCKPQMHLPHQLLQFAEFRYHYLSKMRNFTIVFIQIIIVSLLTD